jgi:SHS family lactate transporter-like MFS transporter
MFSLLWFAVMDGSIAFAGSFTTVLVLRTLFGFGMGAEWTAGTTWRWRTGPSAAAASPRVCCKGAGPSAI